MSFVIALPFYATRILTYEWCACDRHIMETDLHVCVHVTHTMLWKQSSHRRGTRVMECMV